MTFSQYIFRSLWHYRRRNLNVALGMAVSMAVITGALVTGDSVRSGLQNLVGIRLGEADLAITTGERYLTDTLAGRLSEQLQVPATPVLELEGSATSDGGEKRIPRVKVYGIDETFRTTLGEATFSPAPGSGEAVISDNLAVRLNVREGDEILVRINNPGPVPIDAPFVSEEGNILSIRLTVRTIAGKSQHGRFNLQSTQVAPFNVFVNLGDLQEQAGLKGFANLILMAGEGRTEPPQVSEALVRQRTLEDAGLRLDRHPLSGEWLLRTPRVFFDPPVLEAIESVPVNKSLWFSYFVNEIRLNDLATPYSFVSTLPGSGIGTDEIIINRWLATDLNASPGDTVSMSYFLVGPLRNLITETREFRVAAILPDNDPLSDRVLMPEIPGLSDAGNCRDWETSIPIDLSRIRDKDEEYWKRYRGTPKAFINLATAAGLWQNRFGAYTQVRFPAESRASEIEAELLRQLDPSETGMTIAEPAKAGKQAASGGVDFGGLFLGLSFFLIAGGIILTVLLVRLGLESRSRETGTLRALGWPGKQIRLAVLMEQGLTAILGTLLGLGLTWIYTVLIFKALNGVWNDAVLTDSLQPVFKPFTLIAGSLISMLVSFGSAWLALVRFLKHQTLHLLQKRRIRRPKPVKRLMVIGSLATGITAACMLPYGLIASKTPGPVFFFLSGTLMLISLLMTAAHILNQSSPTARLSTISALGRSNLRRNRSRSLSLVLLLSIGTFLVIAIGANRLGTNLAGTGGFLFYMETTVPVPDNLNEPAIRGKYGLETQSGFVQMKVLEGDDASCLNLNRVSNPPLLGIPDGSLKDRFTFVSNLEPLNPADPWTMLEQQLPGGAIPAVADQTVIQWGLGLSIGDTLMYQTERGDTVRLVLIGGLANSVFQGNLLISSGQLSKYWPSTSGTRVMLVSGESVQAESIQQELSQIFRDYGTDIKTAEERLGEFNAVENTYLSIFLILGAFAMLLGTIGLAVVLVRNLRERRPEIGLLRATGFSTTRILQLIAGEYGILLMYSTLTGGIPALISVLPVLMNPLGEVSPLFLGLLPFVLFANGLAWILLLGYREATRPEIISSLREE